MTAPEDSEAHRLEGAARGNGGDRTLPPAAPEILATARPPKDIVIESDLLRVVISESGARMKECLLKHYPTANQPGAPPVNLINVAPPNLPLALRIGQEPPLDLSAVLFEADRDGLSLENPGQQAAITFTHTFSNGASIQKVFTFRQGTYLLDLSVQVRNMEIVQGSVSLFNRPNGAASAYIFEGPSYYSAGGFEEVSLDPGEKFDFSGPIDWAGYGDNYFLTAVIPESGQGPWNLRIEKRDPAGLTEVRLGTLQAAGKEVGEAAEILRFGLYFGPKDIDRLKALGHNLASAINFGWFDPIAKPLLYLLKFFFRFLHNYGLAIILLTVLIKIAFWPLAQKSAQSMKTMQKLQPKLAKLKEKYGDDKERLNKELMQLYRTYKVNPMSGCLPMLLQIPVFFALYKVLLQAIELRHAPFSLWINDLSAPDRLMIPGVEIPYLGGIPVLTLLMGASMFLQQKMSPTSLDPTQARMMMMLPLVFTFFFINFPSGLVLYWLVNNILSIAQQYYVNKFTA